MTIHPLVDAIASGLGDVVAKDVLQVDGVWSSSKRNTYKDRSQLGSGEGPYVKVIDHRWKGFLRSAKPLVGIGFQITEADLWWAKSPPPEQQVAVDISLASANAPVDGATFTASVGGSFLPGVPVRFDGDLTSCALGSGRSVTGQPYVVARPAGATFVVVAIPAEMVKVGRNRLWYLRDTFSSRLPDEPRRILTGARTGTWSAK